MEQIKNLLEARKNYLSALKEEKERALQNAPEGVLRICKHGKKTQYYQRNNPKNPSGVYIREKDIELARQLAQKDYDKKVLCNLNKELSAIEKYFSNSPKESANQIYERLHKERRKLICPIQESEEQYVMDWENVQYQGKGFDRSTPEFYTVKGERVRSKSEVIIADLLKSEGIPYRYECPIRLEGWGIFYPDFTVLNVRERKEIYWEHLGMMDDINYVERALERIMIYESNGIFPGENLILTYETSKRPLNQKMVRVMMERYLK